MRKFVPAALLGVLAASMLALLAGAQKQAAGLYLGPYVSSVTENAAKILWVTAAGAPADSRLVVEGGVTVGVHSKHIAQREELLHVATVRGLKAGQTYRYRVGDTAGEFQAAAAPSATVPLRFAVYGDTRSYPKRHHAVAAAMDREGPLAFVVHTGDLTGGAKEWDRWKEEFFEPAQDLLRHTTLWPTLGNHELDGAQCRAIFDLPGSYYSFDCGNVHWIVLDSEPGDKADPAMLGWLEKDLTASKAQWKMVSYHRPTFDINTARYTWGQTEVLPILEKCGVDMVMSGHNHNYQRFRPIGPAEKKPIIFVVSAGGGAPSYPISPSPLLEKSYSGIHYCVFTVTGNTLEMTAKLPDGTVLDRLKLVHTAGKYQKEIMDRAVSTTFACAAAFILTGFPADAAAALAPGKPCTLSISPKAFPAGAKVEITSAAPATPEPGAPGQGRWTVTPATLTGWNGGVDVKENAEKRKSAPLAFTAAAPADLRPSFEPELRVSLRVTYEGQTYTTDNAPVWIRTPAARAWETIRGGSESR